jgi:hypothetical protein
MKNMLTHGEPRVMFLLHNLKSPFKPPTESMLREH